MFYLWMTGAWSGHALLCILVITLGNCTGGILLAQARSFVAGK